MSLKQKVWQGIWTGTVASIVEYIVRIPRMMVIARVLGPEYYGILGIFSVFREVFGRFVQLGTGDAIIQFLAEDKKKQKYKNIKATIKAASLIRLITLLICITFFFLYESQIIGLVSNLSAVKSLTITQLQWLLRLLLLGIAIQALEGPFGNALQAFQVWKSLFIVRIVGAIISALFPIIAAILGYHLLGIVISQQLSFFFVACMIIYFYLKKIFPFLKDQKFNLFYVLKQAKNVLYFGLPLLFAQVFRLIYTYTDQIMLAYLAKGPQALSFYEVARNCAMMLAFIPTLLRSVMFPATAEFFADRNIRRLEALFTFMVKHLFWLISPLAMWMAVLSPVIIKIMAGPKYLQAAKALAILAILRIMLVFGVPFFTCLVGAFKRTGLQFIISFSGGLLNVALNAIWIPKYGYMGAIYATAIGHVLSFFLAYHFLSSCMTLRFPIYSMLISIIWGILSSMLLFIILIVNKILLLFFLPLAVSLYLFGIIRFGLFDYQDIEYLSILLKPFEKKFGFLFVFIKKYSRSVNPENVL